jgi:hypothetical protein
MLDRRILSIDVGLKSFTAVLMIGERIESNTTRDLSGKGKGLPEVVSTLKQLCDELIDLRPQVVLVEKQLGKYSFA